jgi:hypothetical protein
MKVKERSIIAVLVLVLTRVAACGPAKAPATSVPVEPVTASSSETDVSPELDQLFEDYIAAFNAYDAEALQALLTDGYMMYEQNSWDSVNSVSSGFSAVRPIEWVIAGVKSYHPNMETQWQGVGEPIMSGDGPWLVAQVIRNTSKMYRYPDGIEGILTITVIEEDGTLKVARHVLLAFDVE